MIFERNSLSDGMRSMGTYLWFLNLQGTRCSNMYLKPRGLARRACLEWVESISLSAANALLAV